MCRRKKKWQKTFWVKFALPYPALTDLGSPLRHFSQTDWNESEEETPLTGCMSPKHTATHTSWKKTVSTSLCASSLGDSITWSSRTNWSARSSAISERMSRRTSQILWTSSHTAYCVTPAQNTPSPLALIQMSKGENLMLQKINPQSIQWKHHHHDPSPLFHTD